MYFETKSKFCCNETEYGQDWFPVYNHVKSFTHSSNIGKNGCCVPRSNCCYFVYNPWTILVCSRRLYLFLKVRLQNWQTAVGMPMC